VPGNILFSQALCALQAAYETTLSVRKKSCPRCKSIGFLLSGLTLLLVAPSAFALERNSRANSAPNTEEMKSSVEGKGILKARGTSEKSASDQYELSGRLDTNLQIFGRALLPGPGGESVPTQTISPIHQSLSLRATQVDSPVGEDSVEVQVAAWGQIVLGQPQDIEAASWDLASAFITQRFDSLRLTLGRQSVAGGAARYSRFDGGRAALNLPFDLTLDAYGGWTVLPRWNKPYGYHNLEQNLDDWAKNPEQFQDPKRRQNWLAGARMNWQKEGVASLGVSLHQQKEHSSLTRQTLGMSGSFTQLERAKFFANALLSTEQSRFSRIRLSGDWDAVRAPKIETNISIRGEFLHSTPSLMLSQASIFSIFSYQEINEWGGELRAALPLRLRADFSGYAQLYNEGSPGYRSSLKFRYALDDRSTLILRTHLKRVVTESNGYWMARAAGSYVFTPRWSLMVDSYQYLYDQEIRSVASSSFYAAHLKYFSKYPWNARLGSSLSRSPYAKADARILARFTYNLDSSSPLRGGGISQ